MDKLLYQPAFSDENHPPGPPGGTVAVAPTLMFGILWRRKLSIALTAALLGGAVVVGVSQIRPSFVATASVLMQDHKPVVAEILNPSGTTATDSVAVRTQVDILKSADLARSIVRKLDLTTRPEFSPAAPSATRERILDVIHPYDRLGVLAALGLFAPPQVPDKAEREEIAAQALLGMTSIVNDGHSYVIDIRVKVTAGSEGPSHAAALGAELANAYAEAYTQFTSKVKANTMRQVNSFFDERVASLQQRMRLADEAVQAYRTTSGLIEDRAAGSGSITIASQQMAQLNGDLISAAADRTSKEASLQQITLARAGRGDLQSVAEVVSSPLIQRLREQQAVLGSREAALATSLGAGSPTLIAIHGSQRDTAAQIASETAKIAASLRASVDSARTREEALRTHLAQLQAQVGAQGQSEIRLHELQNDAEIARTIYSTYLKRAHETATQVDMQEPDALVVSRAGIPMHPAPPGKAVLAAAGLVASVLVASLLGLIRERLRSGFRSGEQLATHVGIRTLGFLPKVRHLNQALTFTDRHSAFSQAVFSIRALLRLNMTQGSQLVMVTSALPQEGKTFFASSLARNAALAGERVLLVDCDLRRPAVMRNITSQDNDALDGITIRRDGASPLDIITLDAGRDSPQDLFASVKMRNLLVMLRNRYDLVLLDTPPVLAVSDARVLAALADQTVLVVRWDRTSQALVNNAVAALRASGAEIAGAVITQVKMRDLTPADGGQAYVYHNYMKYLPASERP